MHFGEEELREIGVYVQSHFNDWLKDANSGREIEIRENLVRLEIDSKEKREMLSQHMTFTEKRFEQVDKRFEQVDKRFESVEQRLINIEKGLRNFIYSSFSFTAVTAGVIIAVLKFT